MAIVPVALVVWRSDVVVGNVLGLLPVPDVTAYHASPLLQIEWLDVTMIKISESIQEGPVRGLEHL